MQGEDVKMPSTVLTSKGQITLPIEVRQQLGLKVGDRVDFVRNAKTGQYEVGRKTTSIAALRGMVKQSKPPVSIDEMDRAIGDGILARYDRARKG